MACRMNGLATIRSRPGPRPDRRFRALLPAVGLPVVAASRRPASAPAASRPPIRRCGFETELVPARCARTGPLRLAVPASSSGVTTSSVTCRQFQHEVDHLLLEDRPAQACRPPAGSCGRTPAPALPGPDSAPPRPASRGSSPRADGDAVDPADLRQQQASRTRRSAMARYSALSVSSSLSLSSSSSRPSLRSASSRCQIWSNSGLHHASAAPGNWPCSASASSNSRFSRSRDSWSYSRWIRSRDRLRAARPASSNAQLLRQLVVDRRHARRADSFLAVISKVRGLAGQLVGAVLGRGSRPSIVRVSPGLMPSSCSVKPGMKPSPPISTSMSFAGAAGEFHAVDLADEIDRQHLALGGARDRRAPRPGSPPVRDCGAAISASALSTVSARGLGLQPGQR